jgi:hypothetical protein
MKRTLLILGVVVGTFVAAGVAWSSGVLGGGPAAASAGVEPPNNIDDSFNGGTIDSSTWSTDIMSPGTTAAVKDGALVLSASSAAGDEFHDGILANCQARGDFVARASFVLTQWPANDGVSFALNAPPLGNTFTNSATGGEIYGLFVAPSGFTTIPTDASSGELRLVRRGDVTTGYERSNGSGWITIGSFAGSTDDTFVGVAIWNTGVPFGGQPVSVRVTAFHLYAQELVCPG